MANVLNVFRAAAQVTTAAAGVGSVALVIADRVSHRSASSRATLHCLMLIVGIASVAVYVYVAAKPPRTTPASVFVIIPMVSWGLIVTVVPIAAFMSHRR